VPDRGYLATVIDLDSRRMVGSATAEHRPDVCGPAVARPSRSRIGRVAGPKVTGEHSSGLDR
jgi:hypothetical protein